MGVLWVPEWIELERNGGFSNIRAQRVAGMRNPGPCCAREAYLLCWPKPYSAWPSLWSALKKSAIGCGSATTDHVTPLFSRPLSQEERYIQSAGDGSEAS